MAAPILLAYDPVLRDRAPVRFAAAVAGFTGAPVQVTSVYAAEDVLTALAAGQLAEDLPGDPGEALEEVERELRGMAITAERLAVGAASAPSGVTMAAMQTGAALVVVGSSARASSGRLLPGSTGERLLNGAPCAVAVVPAGWDVEPPFATFVAGFVDTAEGRAAAVGAHALAGRAGATLRVLTAVRAPPWSASGDEDAVVDDLRVRAGAAAESAMASLLGARVDADVAVRDPAAALLEASADAQLLVCGSRGYGPPSVALLGGVTLRVVSEAACPVIVAARAAEVELPALLSD